MLKVQLTRDLRKNILRGHPWVYRQALELKGKTSAPCMVEVLDKKGKSLGWGIYSPEGPLALRILSVERKPPNPDFFKNLFEQAWLVREPIRSKQTNAYRLFNGEGDGLPGLVCDVYATVAVLQFDGPSCFEFWDQEWMAQWLLEKPEIKTVYCKPRRSEKSEALTFGDSVDLKSVEIVENSVRFLVNIEEGQKTGFFLDQRDNRNYLKTLSANKSVLNLFSYTGGFSIYAGLGGAREVTSVDLSKQALDLANQSWALNDLDPGKHKVMAQDVFATMAQFEQSFDIVMVDPPSLAPSEKTKPQAVKAYGDIFSKAAELVGPNSHLVLSSCSSHVDFEDFFNIIDETLSLSRRTGKILRVSGQGSDHPFPHFCRELRYLKFVDIILS